jgi:hypothetical protein
VTDLQALLVPIAEGCLDGLPVLADWLEDHGDGRARAARAGVDCSPYRSVAERSLAAFLALFPEGPRWRVHYRNHMGQRRIAPRWFLTSDQAKDHREACRFTGMFHGRVYGPVFRKPRRRKVSC